MIENKVVVGISQGDLNGIGLEIILKTLSEPGLSEICVPILFSSQKTVSYFRKMLNLEEFNFNPLRDFTNVHTKKPNVFICYEEEVTIEMGKPTTMSGKYAKLSLEAATMALFDKKIDVLVTAPINKYNIQSEEFKFPGHTDYLNQELEGDALMLMVNDSLRVGLFTDHIPVTEVSKYLTEKLIRQKIATVKQSLMQDFKISKPKIAVLGLNPHCGDHGVIGKEDDEVIRPTIKKLFDEGTFVFGPYAADSFFGNNSQEKFDAVIACYHDQGLIPFKTLSFGNGVNYTAGLNKIRTSPDHGTAFEIAGKNQADFNSFKEAVYLALDIYKSRMEYAQITEKPLKTKEKQF